MCRTMEIISTSWSPNWRRDIEWFLDMVSRFACPEITIIPMESTYAPKTPLRALMDPGPAVTFTAANLPDKRK